MKDILLFPFNGNAREALSTIEAINKLKPTWNILGFMDDDPQKTVNSIGNYDVLGGREILKDHLQSYLLAVPGRPENFKKRVSILQSLNWPNERFATIIHPSVQIGTNCSVGVNTLLMAGVVLTSKVTIGQHVVILPNTVISHDSTIHDYCMIGSNVSISGSVTIKNSSYIGSGTKIIQEVTIGPKSLAGLGSVVVHDIPPSTTVAGHPARQLKGSR